MIWVSVGCTDRTVPHDVAIRKGHFLTNCSNRGEKAVKDRRIKASTNFNLCIHYIIPTFIS